MYAVARDNPCVVPRHDHPCAYLITRLCQWEYGIFALQDTLEQPAGIVGLAGAILAIAAFEARSFKSWEAPEGSLGSAQSTYFKMKVCVAFICVHTHFISHGKY